MGRRRVVAGIVVAVAVAAVVATTLVVGGTDEGELAAPASASASASEPAPAEEGTPAVDPVGGLAEQVAAGLAVQRAQLEAEEAERAAAEEAEEQARRAEAEAREREAEAARAAEAEREAADAQRQRVEAQERLIELGYLVGAADGQDGQQTSSALMAFQAVNGLTVDGALGPQTLAALESPAHEPQLRGGAANRIEVDMDRQILHLVENDRRVVTMNVSTGRGGTFESESGETLRAETPVGTFTIDRRIRGEHASSYGIGSMWDPMYFYGPWAIHGSPDVPAGPASAGCVRVAMADGRWLFDRVPDGTPVVLYGGTHVFTP